MNKQRMIVLGLAVVAAAGAALLARGLMGGGTTGASATPAPPQIAMSEVLVADKALEPGDALKPELVRWQQWPTSSVAAGFITQKSSPDLNAAVQGMVVRAPLVAGEPLSDEKVVRGDATGFMAATLTQGMRAMAIQISIATVAGGFIQANDRVDIILTEKVGEKRSRARTILSDVRVLAIDQAADSSDDKKAVSDAKTATLELSPPQAELVSRAASQGTLSLSLRSLAENLPNGRTGSTTGTPSRAEQARLMSRYQVPGLDSLDDSAGEQVKIIRYGISRPNDSAAGGGEN